MRGIIEIGDDYTWSDSSGRMHGERDHQGENTKGVIIGRGMNRERNTREIDKRGKT
jgi:hypothetical protein